MPDDSPLVKWDAEDYELLDRMHTAIGTALQAMDEAKRLRVERDEYKKKYNDLLDDSLKHAGETTANWIAAIASGKLKVEVPKRKQCRYLEFMDLGSCMHTREVDVTTT